MHLLSLLIRLLAAGIATAALSACATVPPSAGSNPVDPWERYNRHMSEFNDRVDAAVLKPVSQAYADYVPGAVRTCVGNAFSNALDVPNALNNALQGKATAAASDVSRVAVNSTIGLLGCFDVASRMGLDKSNEDFGQTLGKWGAGPGPYFVLPFLGPSSVRDSLGRVVGFYTNPIDYVDPIRLRNSLWGLSLIDTRVGLFPAERLLDGALDRYQFIRDGYLQRRRSLIYDGNPPRVRDEDEEAARDTGWPPGVVQPSVAQAR